MKLNFIDAVKHSKENGSVWRRDDDGIYSYYMKINKQLVIFYSNREATKELEEQSTSFIDINTIWILVELEKKTLSDKIIPYGDYRRPNIPAEDVKEAFKELDNTAIMKKGKRDRNSWWVQLNKLLEEIMGGALR